MNIVTILALRPGEEPILAGRLTGKRVFLRSLEELPPITKTTIVILDFHGVDLATSSFLSEAVLPLRDHLRLRRPPAYVVVANLTERVGEELAELLNRSGDAILTCSASSQGDVSNAQLVGSLEPTLLETFDLVRSKGETSAAELYSDANESNGIGPTAWNNRLAALAGKSLVMETSQGRTKKYRPVLEIS